MRTIGVCLTLLLAISLTTRAQEIINLYPGTIPNSKESDVKETESSSPPGMFLGVTKPTLEIYLPEQAKSTGAAVIICPGGGYAVVVYQAEGIRTAKEFAKRTGLLLSCLNTDFLMIQQ